MNVTITMIKGSKFTSRYVHNCMQQENLCGHTRILEICSQSSSTTIEYISLEWSNI